MGDKLEIGDDTDAEAALHRLPDAFPRADLEEGRDLEALRASSLLERATGGGPGLAKDQRLACKLGDRYVITRVPGMVGVDEDDDLMPAEGDGMDAPIVHDVRQDGDVSFEIEDVLQGLVRVAQQHADLDRGIGGKESGDHVRRMKRANGGEAQLARRQAAAAQEQLVCLLAQFHDAAADTVFCIGFAGKLFSDELEAIDMGPVEALRSVGANPLQVFQYAVLPQVRVAFAGIAIYTWDVAFRAATVVGFFGGGGMGWYLKRTTQQLESTRVAAILLVIMLLVLLAEIVSGWLRKKISAMR